MLRLLAAIARHGRLVLVLGLLGGLGLPAIASAMKPFLPFMVAFLVFVSALRIGHRQAMGNLSAAPRVLATVLVFQLGLPLLLIGAAWLFGLNMGVMFVAALIMLSAPSISGAPAFTVLMGHDPAPALRLLIMGTVLLPLTIVPVFWISESLGSPAEVIKTTLRLTAVILISVGLAFVLRARTFPNPSKDTEKALDGLATLTLAVIVIGLMAALGPALRETPGEAMKWLLLVLVLNFGLQFLAKAFGADVASSVVAGNRNVALFLVALPGEIIEPLLLFIGCYQIPMYLTPIVMKRFHAND